MKMARVRKIAVIYDGACGLCTGNVHRLHRLDWFGCIETVPFQSDEVYVRFPSLSRSECEKAMHVVLEDGRIVSGADAIREVLLRMPLTWVLGIFMAIPPLPWLLGKLYGKLAPWRHHMGGSCPARKK